MSRQVHIWLDDETDALLEGERESLEGKTGLRPARSALIRRCVLGELRGVKDGPVAPVVARTVSTPEDPDERSFQLSKIEALKAATGMKTGTEVGRRYVRDKDAQG